MTRHIRRHVLLAMAAFIVSSLSARAQNPPAGPRAERSTELGIFAGAAATSLRTGAAIAGTADWQLTRWIGVEARGSWFERGSGSDAFGADVGALVNVVPRQDVAPYVGLAVGLYRAMFDSPTSPMSNFYRRRMSPAIEPRRTGLTFTDPALRITAGVNILTRRHVTVRPEASALIVRHAGHGDTLAIFGVRIGYRFEDRPITPSPQAEHGSH